MCALRNELKIVISMSKKIRYCIERLLGLELLHMTVTDR